MMMVVRPGLLDLVMDLGRPGFRAQGVPEGGAADAPALVQANRLVGNPDRAAGLEFLLRGPTLRFPQGGRIALAGADMEARLDEVPVPLGLPVDIPAGGVLELGQAKKGLRTYLAVNGGVEVPPVLGSRSTFLPGGFGGWQGRALEVGDVLPHGMPADSGKQFFRGSSTEGPLRILPGPQLAGFTDAALNALSNVEFGVGADANRLGLRLKGPTLKYGGKELPSQAVLPGAIQVPPDGRPIVLGWDGPVTGGYPVIAAVITADLYRLAQIRPGDGLRFRFVSLEQARAASRQQQERLGGALSWGA